MKEYQSLSHTRWDCKYHVVFIPKRRKKRIFGLLRRQLGEIFHELASHKESKIVEGHLMGDHVHMPEHSAEVRSLERSGIHQGQERNSDSPKVWGAAAKLYGRAFLGPRLFRLHGGAGRADGPSIHPESRRRGRAVRPDEARYGVSRHRRLTVLWAPLRRSQSQATGFAGGI